MMLHLVIALAERYPAEAVLLLGGAEVRCDAVTARSFSALPSISRRS
jgi:hypothetical protein